MSHILRLTVYLKPPHHLLWVCWIAKCGLLGTGESSKYIKDNLQKDNIQDKEDIILNEAVFFVTADKG